MKCAPECVGKQRGKVITWGVFKGEKTGVSTSHLFCLKGSNVDFLEQFIGRKLNMNVYVFYNNNKKAVVNNCVHKVAVFLFENIRPPER